jgi:hypothetical protein
MCVQRLNIVEWKLMQLQINASTIYGMWLDYKND